MTTTTTTSTPSSFTPLTLSSPMASDTETAYNLDLHVPKPPTRQVDRSWCRWVQPIAIDDEDITFCGKSLSAWYEEDRRQRLRSMGLLHDEPSRGRERERRHRGGTAVTPPEK
ncbi:hypothetical protein E4U32_001684 [Claviceps aff. humidiphila group G2b]|nr:hypothetical protein E4U32_001684 [Claviceps aff. humidiphila group G2b]